MTNQCIESAVRDAADRGFLVTLVENACATHSQADHDQSLKNLKGFSRICQSDQVIQEIKKLWKISLQECRIHVKCSLWAGKIKDLGRLLYQSAQRKSVSWACGIVAQILALYCYINEKIYYQRMWADLFKIFANLEIKLQPILMYLHASDPFLNHFG